MNPIGNVFCSQCNTRLLSAEIQLPEEPAKPAEEAPAGVKGISLPTLPTAREGMLEPEELPDWLVELTEPSLGKPEEAAGAVEPTPADEFPDWLSDLAGETAGSVTDETPDTFSVEESAPEEETAFSELPDWFSELAGDTSAPEATVPEETTAEETPDWLAGLLEDEPAAVAEEKIEPAEEEAALEELPDWLSDLTPEEPDTAPAEEEPALEELPDWLSNLTPEEPVAAAEEETFEMAPPPSAWEAITPAETTPSSPEFGAEPRAELPDWLLATAVPTPPGEAPVSQPLPEWLAKNAEEIAPGQEAGRQPGAGQFPAWLMKGVEPGTVSAAPRTPAASHPEPVEVQEPARPAVEAVPAPSPVLEPEAAPETGVPVSGTPDWLQGIYEEEIEPQAAAPAEEPAEPEAGEAVEDLPDWLAGIYSEEEDGALADVFTAEPEEEAAPEAGAPETGVPDWLAGIMTEEPVPAQPETPSEGEEAAPKAGETAEDLPDWLSGLAPEGPSAEEEQPSPLTGESSIFTESVPEEPSPTPAPTPEWLKGVAPTDEELALTPEQPAFTPGEAASGASEEEYEEPVPEGAEIPDWLKGLSPAVAPSSVEEEAAFIERVSEDESLVRAEVPSWLQGLRPPGTGPLPPLPEVTAPGADVPSPEEGGLVRAEIPDWVQQLRPVPSSEGEQRPLEPAETEGPLAGLRGVIPGGSTMDMPADFQPAPLPAIPESIVAQAQLWQKLLEQPRSVQRPVAQHRARSGKGQLATRLVVTVILLAVTVLGLLWSDIPLSQAISHPHIEHFSKAIDALEPGDTVIVAVEYGPAEAGEMTILADAVMQHLADREAQVMMVSTLPEGTGLIQSLLKPLALANRLPDGQTAFLPGSSNGVAQFLSKPAEAKIIILLAGRAERLRWWVEQNNATQVLPMAIGVNAATAPLAMPYLETSQVAGWMAGLPDVAAYQQFRGLTSSILDSQLDALMLAHWAALALLLFGLFYYLALGKKGAS